jgi:hypothetical protein
VSREGHGSSPASRYPTSCPTQHLHADVTPLRPQPYVRNTPVSSPHDALHDALVPPSPPRAGSAGILNSLRLRAYPSTPSTPSFVGLMRQGALVPVFFSSSGFIGSNLSLTPCPSLPPSLPSLPSLSRCLHRGHRAGGGADGSVHRPSLLHPPRGPRRPT